MLNAQFFLVVLTLRCGKTLTIKGRLHSSEQL